MKVYGIRNKTTGKFESMTRSSMWFKTAFAVKKAFAWAKRVRPATMDKFEVVEFDLVQTSVVPAREFVK